MMELHRNNSLINPDANEETIDRTKHQLALMKITEEYFDRTPVNFALKENRNMFCELLEGKYYSVEGFVLLYLRYMLMEVGF